jgi:hypothetical protein
MIELLRALVKDKREFARTLDKGEQKLLSTFCDELSAILRDHEGEARKAEGAETGARVVAYRAIGPGGISDWEDVSTENPDEVFAIIAELSAKPENEGLRIEFAYSNPTPTEASGSRSTDEAAAIRDSFVSKGGLWYSVPSDSTSSEPDAAMLLTEAMSVLCDLNTQRANEVRERIANYL